MDKCQIYRSLDSIKPDRKEPIQNQALVRTFVPHVAQLGRSKTMIKTANLIILISLLGCSNGSGLPVKYIVPDGFRGIFTVEPNPEANPIPLVNGSYLVKVPESGRMEVRSMEPFRKWHSHSATYASGQSLPDGDIRFYYSSTDSTGRSAWLVGTEDEKLYLDRINNKDLPLAVDISLLMDGSENDSERLEHYVSPAADGG